METTDYFIIKMTNGIKYSFCTLESESVTGLKIRIADFLQVNKNTLRLLYEGSPLTDEFILKDIPNKSIIHLVSQMSSIEE
jgi:hypothetical protein